ncbi:MAG: hypothetical protein D6683_08070 [Actinomyces sp.]|nr:MAG: hypothetical protein D6683_08070 [Actinomyces sp.]
MAALVRRRARVSATLAGVWALMCLGVAPAVAPLGAVVVARGAGRDWVALGAGRRVRAALPGLVRGGVLVAGATVASGLAGAAWLWGGAALCEFALSRALNPVTGRPEGGPAPDAWYLLAGLADQMLISADTVVLAVLRSSGEAGVYASVYRYPAAWTMVVGLGVVAAVPLVVAGCGPGVARRRWRTALALGVLAASPLVVLGPLAVWSLGPVWGPEFVAGRDALVLLVVAVGLTTVSAPLRVLHVGFGSDRQVALVTVLAAVGNLGANLLLVGTWGMTAAAATTLAAQVALLAYFVTWGWRAAALRAPAVPMTAVTAST